MVKGQRIAVIAASQVLDGSLIDAWTATADHAGLASAKRVDRLVAEVAAARATSDTVVDPMPMLSELKLQRNRMIWL